ncbi:protein kinase interacting protein [Anticarsia gemmatalis nucleopolyhedrovirus]|uniref:Protein kinase interacting protein n=1 Tax=Anticarsia gemmatalis multiple nucleopolyhedrovirus TaxID=268591 RepID=A0A0S3J2M5_9ABAC|nr:protein kinase interacting protein [Anticarsia gemmatalis nucleopolyhedrovirus]ABI13827.1 protein kinase interacting protein [Anticarsia gemmatalis multiple nucleopolyhedrovirus]ALR69925.1 protein kinase interacting protein [Anticarsia gemmatalis multiple nucleopolyhedrovirus]ALR70240.1 protein kinase interacting protein [Anticarsia gemmatalis multiple nucleopolyhedrovirus]ALR70867.1 protein kinase interacting protein [Anticarsia gemmatalis multiple nucleopolyhedrovirus]ALR71025.1 protein k
MDCDLSAAVKKGRALLNAALNQQEKKIDKYFVKPSENNVEKMLILAADIHGQIEQIEALLSVAHAADEEKLEFAKDCSDLDIDPAELNGVCKQFDLSYFATKYQAAKVLALYPAAYDSFLKHGEQLINAVLRLNAENATVNYMVKNKCIVIKHLCAMEYLIDPLVNNKNTD